MNRSVHGCFMPVLACACIPAVGGAVRAQPLDPLGSKEPGCTIVARPIENVSARPQIRRRVRIDFEILDRFRSAGIEIAFPTRHLMLERVARESSGADDG